MVGENRKFDLGQAAKEKDIKAQTMLSFAQMASDERAAYTAGKYAQKAARSGRQKSCYIAGTMVIMKDMSLKKIEDIKIGDEVLLGGKVTGNGAYFPAV